MLHFIITQPQTIRKFLKTSIYERMFPFKVACKYFFCIPGPFFIKDADPNFSIMYFKVKKAYNTNASFKFLIKLCKVLFETFGRTLH